MKLLSILFKYSRRIVVLAIVAGIISGISNAALLALIHTALSNTRGTQLTLLKGFLALWLILPISRIVSQVSLTHLVQKAVYDLRMQLSRQILSAPLRQLEEIGVPRLLAALTDDILSISNALVSIPVLCLHGAILVGCLIYLAWLSWPLLIGVVIFLALGMFSFQLAMKRAGRFMALAREDQDSLFGHFRALTKDNKELNLHSKRRHAFLSRILQETAVAYQRHNVSGSAIYTAASGWGQLLFFLLIGLIVFAAPTVTGANAQVLTGYTLLLLFMMAPLEILSFTLPALLRAKVALNKVESLGLSLKAQATEKDALEQPNPEDSWGQLELVGVTHTYHREKENSSFMLGPIDLTFVPGEMVFITGGNGSGKTTLAKLISGLYFPEEGEIRLNGQPITDENRDSYRQHFTVVFSDFFLFDSLLGLDAPKLDEKARYYLGKLHLEHKLKVEDGRLSRLDLSQGQRKRLALLTAYLEDRSIYLFDEWAADQDPVFKETFYLQLLPELKSRGKTVIVISHDDRYYHVADRVIKLEDGQLGELEHAQRLRAFRETAA